MPDAIADDSQIGFQTISFREWKKCASSVANKVKVLWRVMKHPASPWQAKVLAGCAAAYVVSPIQVIPSFIPVIGQLDDVLVLYLAVKWVRRIVPAAILTGEV